MNTVAVTCGLSLLKENGVLLLTGYAGTGKSRTARHILQTFIIENTSYKCIMLRRLIEWEDMVNEDDNIVVLLDDIFGATNCIYNKKKDTPILETIYAYKCKGNVKVILTSRDTVQRQCQSVFIDHNLFKFDSIDLNSDKFKLEQREKESILAKYMKTVRGLDYIQSEGFVNCHGQTILESCVVTEITENHPVKGFPLAAYQFVHHDKYFELGQRFFDSPTDIILQEINEIRCKGGNQSEDKIKFMIQYGVMVYTAVNENYINLSDISVVKEINKIVQAIYRETVILTPSIISDTVNDILGSHLVKIPDQWAYRFQHQTLQESIVLSFAQIDEANMNNILSLLTWSFFLKVVKSSKYIEKDGEVVLKVPYSRVSFERLASRLVYIYNNHEFQSDFCEDLTQTDIFKHDYELLFTCFQEALEGGSKNDNLTERMIEPCCLSKDMDLIVFLSGCLSSLDETLYFEHFKCILQKCYQIFNTSKEYLVLDLIKRMLIDRVYTCSSLDSIIFTLDMVEKFKIPVLLDQQFDLTTKDFQNVYYLLSPCMIFLSHCVLKAYSISNIPMLEFLLSRYKKTLFDLNLFCEMFYKYWCNMNMYSDSCMPLKWMMIRYEVQELDDVDLILRTACKCQLFDTVKYLYSKGKEFDACSCLKTFLNRDGHCDSQEYANRNKDLFVFLLGQINTESKDFKTCVDLVFKKRPIPDYMLANFIQMSKHTKQMLDLVRRNGNATDAKLILEHTQHRQILSALMSTVIDEFKRDYSLFKDADKRKQIVDHILRTLGCKNKSVKTAFLEACTPSFNITEWLIPNTDMTSMDFQMLNELVEPAINNHKFELVKSIVKKIKMTSLDKVKVLEYAIKSYTFDSDIDLHMLEIFWNETEEKEELQLEEIVHTAFERNRFTVLMWVYKHCKVHIDAKKLFLEACKYKKLDEAEMIFQDSIQTFDNNAETIKKMLNTAYESKFYNLLIRIHDRFSSNIHIDEILLFRLVCEDGKVDLAKRVLQDYKHTLKINPGKLFIQVCENTNASSNLNHVRCKEIIDTIKWIVTSFQITPLDIRSGLFELLEHTKCVQEGTRNMDYLIVFIIEKYCNCQSIKDKEGIEVIFNKCFEKENYYLINWFLEKYSNCQYDKQKILNKACAHAELKTVKILSPYFPILDMNQAMLTAFHLHYTGTVSSTTACLDFMWNELTDKSLETSIDITRIVSTICRERNQHPDSLMIWILRNFHHDQIQINEVFRVCCEENNYDTMELIVIMDQNESNKEAAFVELCRKRVEETEIIKIVDLLFPTLTNKVSCLTNVLENILTDHNFNLLLYFLMNGYCRNTDMNSLLNQGLEHGNMQLVQWILENINHEKLDIKSKFNQICTDNYDDDNKCVRCDCEIEDENKLKCVALMRYYMQDITMCEIDMSNSG